jgi:hypothetical protein
VLGTKDRDWMLLPLPLPNDENGAALPLVRLLLLVDLGELVPAVLLFMLPKLVQLDNPAWPLLPAELDE